METANVSMEVVVVEMAESKEGILQVQYTQRRQWMIIYFTWYQAINNFTMI